jgi:ribosomal protein S3
MYERLPNILKKWKEESGVTNSIQFKRLFSRSTNGKCKLTIYTSRPGWLIGKAGCYADKYITEIKKEFGYIESIEIIETDGEV